MLGLSRKCRGEPPAFAPASGQRWSDVCDSGDECPSEPDEECRPQRLVEAVAGRELTATPHRSGGSSKALDPYAPEFLPTLSMECPVVGVCTVVAEEHAEQPGVDEATPAALVFLPAHLAAPVGSRPLEAERASPPSRSAAPGPDRRRESGPAPVETLPQPPQVAQAVAAECPSLRRRLRSIEIVKATKEYELHLQRRRLCGPDAEPLTPDAADPKLAKRAWERELTSWRCKLRDGSPLEAEGRSPGNRHEAASLVSTEAEEQMSEVDDSTTVISDDASSAHCSSN